MSRMSAETMSRILRLLFHISVTARLSSVSTLRHLSTCHSTSQVHPCRASLATRRAHLPPAELHLPPAATAQRDVSTRPVVIPLTHSPRPTMISDHALADLANGLGIAAMACIVLYHFVAVNGKRMEA